MRVPPPECEQSHTITKLDILFVALQWVCSCFDIQGSSNWSWHTGMSLTVRDQRSWTFFGPELCVSVQSKAKALKQTRVPSSTKLQIPNSLRLHTTKVSRALQSEAGTERRTTLQLRYRRGPSVSATQAEPPAERSAGRPGAVHPAARGAPHPAARGAPHPRHRTRKPCCRGPGEYGQLVFPRKSGNDLKSVYCRRLRLPFSAHHIEVRLILCFIS